MIKFILLASVAVVMSFSTHAENLIGYPKNEKYPYDDQLVVHVDGTINGSSAHNVHKRLEEIRDDAPYVILAIRSPGGYNLATIDITTNIMRYVVNNDIPLVTYAYDYCSSNCTVVFSFGDVRIANPNTDFGFHGSSDVHGLYFHGMATRNMIRVLRQTPNVDQALFDQMIEEGVFMKVGKNYTIIPNSRLLRHNFITMIDGD